MSVRLTCPYCEAVSALRTPPAPGAKARCPECGETFVIEGEGAEADEGIDDPGVGERPGGGSGSSGRTRSGGRKAGSGGPSAGLVLGLLGGGILLLLLLCGGGGYYFVVRPAMTEARKAAQRVQQAAERAQQQIEREQQRMQEQAERDRRDAAVRNAANGFGRPPSGGGATGSPRPSSSPKTSKTKSSPARPAPPPKPSELDQALEDLRSPDDSKRHWAAAKLSKLPVEADRKDEANELLEKSLATGGTFAPGSAVAALAVWGDAKSVEPLSAALRSTDNGNLKKSIVKTLVALDPAASVPVLIDELQSKDAFYRGDVMKALAGTQDPRGIEPIAQWVPDFFARRSAKEALVAYGPTAEEATAKLLAHADRGAQEAALEVLKEIGTPKSLPALRQAAADGRLSRKAQEAIDAVQSRGR